jgi:hypothetical protein
MALEVSDRLIDIMHDIMGKSKEINQDLRKKCRPPQVWFILEQFPNV